MTESQSQKLDIITQLQQIFATDNSSQLRHILPLPPTTRLPGNRTLAHACAACNASSCLMVLFENGLFSLERDSTGESVQSCTASQLALYLVGEVLAASALSRQNTRTEDGVARVSAFFTRGTSSALISRDENGFTPLSLAPAWMRTVTAAAARHQLLADDGLVRGMSLHTIALMIDDWEE